MFISYYDVSWGTKHHEGKLLLWVERVENLKLNNAFNAFQFLYQNNDTSQVIQGFRMVTSSVTKILIWTVSSHEPCLWAGNQLFENGLQLHLIHLVIFQLGLITFSIKTSLFYWIFEVMNEIQRNLNNENFVYKIRREIELFNQFCICLERRVNTSTLIKLLKQINISGKNQNESCAKFYTYFYLCFYLMKTSLIIKSKDVNVQFYLVIFQANLQPRYNGEVIFRIFNIFNPKKRAMRERLNLRHKHSPTG